ncbi:MAG: 30S ribosomal protein S1, partial [Armatimonadota bacterium]
EPEAEAAEPPPAPETMAEAEAAMAEALPEFREGDIVEGTTVDVTEGGVLVDIGAKYEGLIPIYEFPSPSEVPKAGDAISVAIVRIEDEEGGIVLSKKRADYEHVWNRILQARETGEVVTAMVTERVKGGLRVDLGVQGFVPASQVGARRLRDLDRFVGRSLRLKVIEADRAQKKVILSHRQVLEEERKRRREETMAKLVEGAVFEGRVRNITDYGAFVDLGGVDGLLHISEMSWTRINHPSEVVKVGDTIQVMVLKIDRKRDRISLGLRQILPDPWKEVAKKLRVGSVVDGRVTRVVPFGAFVQIEGGIEGIVPNSELTEKRGVEAKEVVQAGDEMQVKILNIRLEERRMTLSRVQAMQQAEREEYQKYMRGQRSERPTLGDMFGEQLEQRKAELEARQEQESKAAKPRRKRKAAKKAKAAPEAEEPQAAAEAEEPAETAEETEAEAPQAEAESAEPAAEAPQPDEEEAAEESPEGEDAAAADEDEKPEDD